MDDQEQLLTAFTTKLIQRLAGSEYVLLSTEPSSTGECYVVTLTDGITPHTVEITTATLEKTMLTEQDITPEEPNMIDILFGM